MESIVLFDTPSGRINLLPFTYTRPSADVRVGILKISEKWQRLSKKVIFLTESYLEPKFPFSSENALYISGVVCPNQSFLISLNNLKSGQKLVFNSKTIAFKGQNVTYDALESFTENLEAIQFSGDLNVIENVWDIFRLNAAEIKYDFAQITQGRTSQPIIDKHTMTYAEEQIFIEEGAKLKACVLNAEGGPIYIGKNAEVQEGAVIRGPFALCEGSHVNMGAKVRGDSTVGPFSKVGGEISNSVIFGFSNKGHDGFLGNSVIGEWCNLGADTNTSNLKNNYEIVKIWNYEKEGFKSTGLQFCGLIMGDHSKCGINTMFNTGTVVGVNANIFGDGFPRNFIPSYSWGGASGFTTYQTKKAFEVADVVMKRRNMDFGDTDKNILEEVFNRTSKFRVWDKK